MKDKRVAVITGAADSLGRALAEECAKRGFSVVLADSVQAQLFDALELLMAHEIETLAMVTEPGSFDSLSSLAESTVEHFGRIDYLFNLSEIVVNAAPVWETSIDQCQAVVEKNIYACLQMLRAFVPFMRSQDDSCHIVNIAKPLNIPSHQDSFAYQLARQSLLALTESLQRDLLHVDAAIHVSLLCPEPKEKLLDTFPVCGSESLSQLAYSIVEDVNARQLYISPLQAISSNRSIVAQT